MMTLTHELESLIAERAGAAKAAYLDAVVRSAAGEQLDPAETLTVIEAVNVTPAAFAADVERQMRRIEAAKIVAGKKGWQTALDDAEAERLEITRRHSAERGEMDSRHSAELAGVLTMMQDAEAALQQIKAAEKLLAESEGVSALDPNPYRPIFGVVTRVDEGRGFVSIESPDTATRGHDLYTRYAQWPIGIDPGLVGRRVELEWFDSDSGRKLRMVRVLDEAPASAG